jgi:hypothetical protein
MIEALNSRKQELIVQSFHNLGFKVNKPYDFESIEKIATSLLDTRKIDNFIMNPFNQNNPLKINPILNMPSELYYVIRVVQLFRGISFAFDLDFSIAKAWSPYAKNVIKNNCMQVRKVNKNA